LPQKELIANPKLLVRSPNIVAYWDGSSFIFEDFVARQRIQAAPLVAQLLDAFSAPQTASFVRRALPPRVSSQVAAAIRLLQRKALLIPARKSPPPDVAKVWRGSFAAAYCHFASRDVRYAVEPAARFNVSAEKLARAPQPPLFKEYPQVPVVPLPKPGRKSRRALFGRLLQTRRTVREFVEAEVPLPTLAGLIRGTWGMTGYIDGGVFGRLLAKTSPSAGARHPVECYVIAWRVRGLPPGLYHYNVKRDVLERLRRGDLRDRAVSIASGQKWISAAAFLVILTVVADRVFWKYGSSDAYRLFFLDAGHLAQTFALLATEAGLGPFTTAAIQETKIEKLIGLDGVREFPVYLCGAGVPKVDTRDGDARWGQRNDLGL
jgi:SagB-type dehydrogenase family enzyme